MEELKFFVCQVCNTAYAKAEYASHCEKRGLERLAVEVGKIYILRVPAVTSLYDSSRQRRTIMPMHVKVTDIQGPLAHATHHTSSWRIRLPGERVICQHSGDPPHPEGPHVYYTFYCILNTGWQDVLPCATLNTNGKIGSCSQEHFCKYICESVD